MGIHKFIDKHGKARWLADYRDASGKRIRVITGTTKASAQEFYAKKKTEVFDEKHFGLKKQPGKLLLEDVAREYLDYLKLNSSPGWARNQEYTLEMFKVRFNGKSLDQITPSEIEKFKADRSKEGVKPLTINKNLACLRGLVNYAKKMKKFAGDNFVAKDSFFKVEEPPPRYLREDEMRRLLPNCTTPYLKAIVELAINTGMRRGEILSLRWESIDLKTNFITLTKTKGKKVRHIPLNKAARDILSALCSQNNALADYVFTNSEGKPFTDIKKSFKTALRKAKIDNFRFHDLRHTFASYEAMAGVDLNTIRELLGHKTMTMTMRYAHLSDEHRKQAVDLLGDKLKGIISANPTNPTKEVDDIKE